MNKYTTRYSEEDLWHWAERRDTPIVPHPIKRGDGSPSKPTEAMARRWLSLLGFSRAKRG